MVSGPDTCERCGSPGHLRAYWRPQPALCAPCARYLADELDRRDCWPPVPWTDADHEVVS